MNNYLILLFFTIIFPSCKEGKKKIETHRVVMSSRLEESKSVDSLYADRFELVFNKNPKTFIANKLIIFKNDTIVNEIQNINIVNKYKKILTENYNRSYHCPNNRIFELVFFYDSLVKIKYKVDLKMFKNLVVFSPPGYNRCVVLKEKAFEEMCNYRD